MPASSLASTTSMQLAVNTKRQQHAVTSTTTLATATVKTVSRPVTVKTNNPSANHASPACAW